MWKDEGREVCRGQVVSGLEAPQLLCIVQRPPGSFKRAKEEQLALCLRNGILHGEEWIEAGRPPRKLPRRARFKEPS